MHTVYSIEIESPVRDVFCWFTERDKVARWLPHLRANQATRATASRVGSSYRQVYAEGGRLFEFRVEITAFEPNKRLATRAVSRRFDVVTDYRFEDLGSRTRLTEVADYRFRGWARVVATIRSRAIRNGSRTRCARQLASLKQLCETSSDAANRR